jgi:coenzyme F420-0:L-glutamate ligase/coenzyme F420-1:gamma-L-glutamate ligase
MNRFIATTLPGIPLVEPSDDLGELTLVGLQKAGLALRDDDVLVYASKVLSKAEGRFYNLNDIKASPASREVALACDKDPRLVELILAESKRVLRIRPGLIVVEHRLGFVCANAGIDHSNTNGDDDTVLLLPTDPDASARHLQQALAKATGADVAIIINDSHGRAWRQGTVGITIGVAGMSPLTDRRGDPDLFGRTLRATLLGTADEIAAAASILQGGADESSPIVHLRGAIHQSGSGRLAELLRPLELDMFR